MLERLLANVGFLALLRPVLTEVREAGPLAFRV